MRALVTGATGFVGRKLLQLLERPVVLSRDPERARRALGADLAVFPWDPEAGPPPAESLRNIDAIFHLAGETVAGRWNEAKKQRIRESRVRSTQRLVKALEAASPRPAVLVCASGVGYYGDRADEVLEEISPPGQDFLAQVCRDWEAEANRARALGVRVVALRTGIALGPKGGALAQMLIPFKLGVGGRLGNGRQWMSWIHLDDLAGLYLHAAERAEISGAVNAVAPAPATNQEFTRALAAALHRPAVFPVPEFALRLAVGEFATALLSSQRAFPRVAEQTGYQFHHPDLAEALRACVEHR